MLSAPKLALVDVFTATPGQGNRAAVCLDAAQLSSAEMQAIAASAPATETAFGLPSRDPSAYDLEVRFFSRTREVPLCGHASIGFHAFRAEALRAAPQTLRMKTGAGVLPVSIEVERGRRRVSVTLAPPRIVATLGAAQRSEVLSALGLVSGDLEDGLPIQIVTAGHAKILVPIRRRAALEALRPDRAALIARSEELGATGYFVLTRDTDRTDVLHVGRMFAPASGVDEDPVTGNANATAGFYLATHRALTLPRDGVFRYRAAQGEAMRRPGIVEVTLTTRDGAVAAVSIGGETVTAHDGAR